jgi:hypothetical protein
MQSEQTVNLTALIIIPLLLASQPDADWAEKLETPDQHTYYAMFSRQFYWIARCWVSRKAFQDDPLRPLLKAGRISRNEYNIIWRSEVMFERLWALCQHTEPFVREVFEQAKVEYTFNAVVLFGQVVKELADSEFALCLQPYVERSRMKQEKSLRLQAKAYAGQQLTKPQQKFIHNEQKQKQETPLVSLVLGVARKTAKKELIIRDALEDYQTACARLLKCQATEWHNLGSHAWVNGQLIKGSESSTYLP